MTIEDFMNRAYPVVVRQTGQKVCVYVLKLHIFVESDTLQSAFDICAKEKRVFYQRLEAIDSLHLIPSLNESTTFWSRIDLQKIAGERLISFVFTLLFWVIILSVAGHQVSKSVGKMNQAFMPAGDEKAEVRLERFKEKLKVVSPYIKEVKKVFNE